MARGSRSGHADRARLSDLGRSPGTLLTTLACGTVAWLGWRAREDSWVTPEEGAGYALGIAGLAAMSLLLLYSLRKRAASLRSWGALRHWFAAHMVLGVAGPTAILFHANFQVRSANARVAFVAMMVVAASGFFGRFIYTRVHRGLYGERETLREITESARATRDLLRGALASYAAAESEIAGLEQGLAQLRTRPLGTIVAAIVAPLRAARTERSVLRILRASERGGDARWVPEATALLRAHLSAVRRVAAFSLWETAFGIWHALHFPLTAALFLAAAIHVVAVHVY